MTIDFSEQPDANGPEIAPELTEALVLRSTGASYRLRLPHGGQTDAVLRGRLRLDGSTSTNPIAVGDHVLMNTAEGVISQILPRKNALLRRAVKQSAQTHVLCANVDQAVVVVTLQLPFTPLGYLDRFLVMCETCHIPPVILFHKIDQLKKDKEWEKLEDYMVTYVEAGYQAHLTSVRKKETPAMLRELLQGKITFIAGMSGAGKSTLINLADPELNLKTGSISQHSGKGRHTTTFAQMHELAFGGWVIDAPGFKEFELTGLEREELGHCYPEMRALMHGCRFNNCTHTNEPGCAVLPAVEDGTIPASRYNTYLGMLEEIDQQKKERYS